MGIACGIHGMKNVHKNVFGNLKERGHLRIMLKWTTRTLGLWKLDRFIWLRTEFGGGLYRPQ
jgi:hypothetical protein